MTIPEYRHVPPAAESAARPLLGRAVTSWLVGAVLLPAATLVPATALAQGSGEARQARDWEFLDLPVQARPAPRVGTARFDGRHLAVTDEDFDDPTALSEGLAPRAVEMLVREGLDAAGLDATLELLDGRVFVRGDAAARAATRRVIEDLERDLDGLRSRLRVRFLRPVPGQGAAPEVLLDERQEALPGSRLVFGERAISRHVTDYDVEVAQSQATADPVVTESCSGQTLHLWTSTALRADGSRQVFVQGLFDLAVLTQGEPFDPNVFELGTIDQPSIRSAQVQFAGALPSEGPLRVELRGLPGGLGDFTVEIAREATGFESRAERVIDFSRGLWRTSLVVPHALHAEIEEHAVSRAITPGGALQLAAALFGNDRGPRPAFGEALVVLPTGYLAGFDRMQSFIRELDPLAPPTTVTVRHGGWSATLPAQPESLLRVAVTDERLLTTEFDAQIAADASLADPITERFIEGFVFEGVIQGSELHGRTTLSRITGVEVRDSGAFDIGRLQLPTLRTSSAPLRVEAGRSWSPRRETSITWAPTGPEPAERDDPLLGR